MKRNRIIFLIVTIILIIFFISIPSTLFAMPIEIGNYELNTLNIINDIREDHNLNRLEISSKLMNVAYDRCEFIIKYNYFNHYYADGSRVCRYGEIFGRMPPSTKPKIIVDRWVSSSTHLAVILNPVYKSVGIKTMSWGNKTLIVVIFSKY
ncbi:MAG: CAP domain-containing protein [Candidatus Pacearchaeota archaeon]|jgi:uncharacterized protein YkwD